MSSRKAGFPLPDHSSSNNFLSVPGSSMSGPCPENFQSKMPMSPHVTSFKADEQLFSKHSRVMELLTLYSRQDPTTLQRKPVSATCIWNLILSVTFLDCR
ncbi:hypothetical protein ATANTOWER_025606 [Ataeniobius toweri]|uniref:Uncharacterized protein n=1 Tax=Ataeniobius toweri TaxID=208326 RepID=A0ABU7B8I7_9TELE|nr:hypothetical protein [Ataeniobius toweri]